MDSLAFWRDKILECLESEQEFGPRLERYRVERFAEIFLACHLPTRGPDLATEAEAEILHLIFHAVHRASCETPVVSISPSAAFLIDFAKAYAGCNLEAVRGILSNFLAAKPGLESEFICARAAMVDYLRGVVKRLEKTGYDRIPANYAAFVVGLFANIGVGLSRLFSASSKVCGWFNLTPDFLTTLVAFYDAITQVALRGPHPCEAESKKMVLSVIQLSLETKYLLPIKNFGTSPSTIVSLFDQLYSILSKPFSADDGVQTKRALYDASLAADLSLMYDYPALLSSLGSPDIACRKAKLDALAVQSTPSYHSTTDVESDDEMLLESKVSQVRDLFPDLDESFVKLCFERLAIDAEGLIARLLEDDLPQVLLALKDQHSEGSVLATRRNIHDNDEFDLLAPGRKVAPLDGVYQKGRMTPIDPIGPQAELKEATIQLVYNQYDDEYDDTYDQDLQGLAEPDETPEDPSLRHEATLYSAYTDNPNLFQKSKEARSSKARASLRHTTGMSDEQLEGWASMLRREPARQKRLGAKLGVVSELLNDQPISEGPQVPPKPPNWAHKDRNKAKLANHRRKDLHQRKLDKT
ncbi:hypothetical protein L0F63_001541 [Massospora cicadina]|nr:hypothetical protein L0F63_001541 [Massospora cicadina]